MDSNVELLAELHAQNVRLLDANPDMEMLELMDMAALGGAAHFAREIGSALSVIDVMKAAKR